MTESKTTDTREHRLAHGIDLLIHVEQAAAESLRDRIRQLAQLAARDAQELLASLDARGPDGADATWLAMHVKELAATKDELRAKLERLRDLRGIVDFASKA